jgi:hypothetical protein
MLCMLVLVVGHLAFIAPRKWFGFAWGLNGNDGMDMIEVLMGLTSNSEIAECCQDVWQGKPGERVAVLFCLCCACWCWLWRIWLL